MEIYYVHNDIAGCNSRRFFFSLSIPNDNEDDRRACILSTSVDDDDNRNGKQSNRESAVGVCLKKN